MARIKHYNATTQKWEYSDISSAVKGETGATPNLQIGTVTTLETGSNATATITGSAENPKLNLGLPRGAAGEAAGAVMYNTTQSLTDAQKTQARNNISAVTSADITNAISGKANLASPALTGTPTAPTAAEGTNTTQIATTAFVQTAISGFSSDVFSVGSSAPSNTKLLWIDTNTSTGGLKYYNGSSWVHVPVAYT